MPESKPVDHSGWGAAIAAAIAGALVGALGTLATGVLNYWNHQNDIDTQMIELSISVLRAKPTEGTTPLREWAINTIEKRAHFDFTNQQKQVLLKEPLPASLIGSAVAAAIRSQSSP
jgi:6-phosphogluconate dehydrogenase